MRYCGFLSVTKCGIAVFVPPLRPPPFTKRSSELKFGGIFFEHYWLSLLSQKVCCLLSSSVRYQLRIQYKTGVCRKQKNPDSFRNEWPMKPLKNRWKRQHASTANQNVLFPRPWCSFLFTAVRIMDQYCSYLVIRTRLPAFGRTYLLNRQSGHACLTTDNSLVLLFTKNQLLTQLSFKQGYGFPLAGACDVWFG